MIPIICSKNKMATLHINAFGLVVVESLPCSRKIYKCFILTMISPKLDKATIFFHICADESILRLSEKKSSISK
jgi:hypothetical protein